MSKLADFHITLNKPDEGRVARFRAAVRSIGTNSVRTTVLRLLSNAHALAVFDQLLVSGTSFVTIVLIGRSTNSAELGGYSIAISLLASMLAVQNALILLPYSILQHRAGTGASEHAGSSLALSGLMSVVASGLMLIVAGGLAVAGARSANMTWALAAVLPFALMREFTRRFSFARLQMSTALTVDMAVAVIQLAGLGYLAWTGAMTAIMACGMLGLACALPALAWLYFARGDFSVRLPELRATAVRSWQLGKWLVLGQLTVQVQSYVAYWLSMLIAGAAVTGVYAACMSIVAFANPLIFGVGNILTPKLALAWKQGGSAGLRKEALRSSLLLAGLMAVFCAVVALAGEPMMRILFHGREYAGHGETVTVLALAMLATAVGMPASNALASMERPRAIVVVGGLGAAITVVLIALLMFEWGLLGAACGFLVGSVVGAFGRWVAFLSIARKSHEPAPISDELRILTGTGPEGAITRLGEGDHASVYAVTVKKAPLQDAVVIKLYRTGISLSMVQAQFNGLGRLHAALHGRVFRGWTLHVPRPLALSQSPLALTMTSIPGQPLDAYAAVGRLGPEVLETASAAFAAIMQNAWARGLIHGDLGLRNVLFDIEARTLALVDPGTLESCLICNTAARTPHAAAFDLGHLLAELVTDVNDLIGNPAARLYKQSFVAGVLRSVLASVASRTEKEHLLSNIRESVAAHLTSTLTLSRSPRGVWHRLIKAVAERRIADMIARLEDDLGLAPFGLLRSRAA
jgi:O-antigen/teichoic acid export membrane protein